MVYTMLKTTFQKSELKQLIFRDFVNFDFESFKNDLLENMVTCDRSYDKFTKNVTKVLHNYARKIENHILVTKNPHINESLRHEIMKR